PVNLPEKAGIYVVPGRPELKLRVFVHHAKGGKPGKPQPTPTPTPTTVCTLEDPQSDALSGVEYWYLPNFVNYYLNVASVPSSVGSQNLYNIASDSFREWTGAIENSVTLNMAGETPLSVARLDGHNIITWGRARSGTLGVTYIWYYSTGLVAEVDTIMNKKYPWSWSNPDTWDNLICAYPDSYDAQNILTHELGHWFGVDDDYDSYHKHNTMYGYGSVMETKKNTLTNGDISAVKSKY
ncbi:hypothetical protein KKG08_01295, partial [Patescibacteria group bacterium]|nr:hypothetical protein [Patescibacteria group bacterium]